MIGNGVPSSCTNIMTRDDDVYEDDESFFATLSSQYENIIFPISSASILIIENDGTVRCYLFHKQFISYGVVTIFLQK